MKVLWLLPVTIAVSVGLMWYTEKRKKEHAPEAKEHRFQNIKLRVTQDVLEGYQSEKEEKQNLLKKTQTEAQELEGIVRKLESDTDHRKAEADACQGSKKSALDGLASVETELKQLQADLDKEKTSWETEMATLKQQLSARSAVCDFLKKGSQPAIRLCGDEIKDEAPKPEEPKAEAPKPEEPKAEAPKPEEPKAEAPKPEEPKAEAPKPEEPKAEAPKPEEPKAEAAKPEEPKAEAPKPEEPKAEAAKPEEPKAEAPKLEVPKAEAPKQLK